MANPAGISPPLTRKIERTIDLYKIKRVEYRKLAMTECGVQLVSWAVIDYRTRARGGTAAGIAWRDITKGAIRSRLAKRKPWHTIGGQIATLRGQAVGAKMTAQQLRQQQITLRFQTLGTKGKARKRILAQRKQVWNQRKAIAAKRKGIRERLRNLRKKRKDMVEAEFALHEIGVDTGRLLASLTYGVPELAEVKVPKPRHTIDSPEKAEWKITETKLRVGSNQKYAWFYDKMRPIFPTGFIDGERQKVLDGIIHKWEQKAMDEAADQVNRGPA